MIAGLSRLYRGQQHVDFMGRRRVGYAISALVLVAGMLALGVSGLHFSIDFKGGVVWELPAQGQTVAGARDALRPLGLGDATVQLQRSALGDDDATLRVEAGPESTEAEEQVTGALADLTGVAPDQVSLNEVGPSWGLEISRKAAQALAFFFVAVSLYIALRFEWRMAVAALAAVVHDILVSVGVYAIAGFTVSPATVIAFLTILGYSLYDTIVVFDKVQENVGRQGAAGGTVPYTGMVNQSMNDVLMRSVNTTLTSVMPVVSIILVGAILGADTLQDFAVALLVGLVTGAYSSIFVAAPILANLKEREPRYAAVRRRAEGRAKPLVPTGARPSPPAASPRPGEGPEEEEEASTASRNGRSRSDRSDRSASTPRGPGAVAPRARKRKRGRRR